MKQAPINAVSQSVMLVFLSMFTATVWAEKIGFVDMDLLINNSPQIQKARQSIELEFEPQYSNIQQKESELDILEDQITKDGPIMSQAELSQLQERGRILERQIRRSKEDLKDAISIRNSQILNQIQKDLQQIVEQYAKDNSYDAILINAILYVSEDMDITDEILRILRQAQKSD